MVFSDTKIFAFIKLLLHRQFFACNCNAVFRNYCFTIVQKKLHRGYAVCQQNLPTEKLREYSVFIFFLQFFRSCCIASTTVKIMRNWWNFNAIKENSIPLSEILMG